VSITLNLRILSCDLCQVDGYLQISELDMEDFFVSLVILAFRI